MILHQSSIKWVEGDRGVSPVHGRITKWDIAFWVGPPAVFHQSVCSVRGLHRLSTVLMQSTRVATPLVLSGRCQPERQSMDLLLGPCDATVMAMIFSTVSVHLAPVVPDISFIRLRCIVPASPVCDWAVRCSTRM